MIMTKFKVGDTVRIRNLTDAERYGQKLHYHIDMQQHEGLVGVVVKIKKRDYGPIYEVETKLGSEWYWIDNWLEPDIQYAGY